MEISRRVWNNKKERQIEGREKESKSKREKGERRKEREMEKWLREGGKK